MNNIALIIHVTGAAVLVGPQVLLFLAVIPSTKLIPDEALRREVTKLVTMRFGIISVVALVALLVTGLYQFYNVTPDVITEDINAFRYGRIFMTKMTLFIVLVGLLVTHGAIIGPRIGRAADAVAAGEGGAEAVTALEGQRRRSMWISGALLLVSLAVLFLGVTLGNAEYSYVGV